MRMKIIEAQALLVRNKAHINPVLYTELMHILERPTCECSDEWAEKKLDPDDFVKSNVTDN